MQATRERHTGKGAAAQRRKAARKAFAEPARSRPARSSSTRPARSPSTRPGRAVRSGGQDAGRSTQARGKRSGTGPTRPAAVAPPHVFDRFAEGVTRVVSSGIFFTVCAATVVVWGATGPFLGFSDSWQLVINTGTTIVTFLMVAVLQNASRRSERAIQHKLDAIADALADFMDKAPLSLQRDVDELREAVGLEDRQGSS